MNEQQLWRRYRDYLCSVESIGMRLDISRMNFDESLFDAMSKPMAAALASMQQLEQGALANRDEQRMVGHYWLRAPELAPTPEIREEVSSAVESVKRFVNDVHLGTVAPERADAFYAVLVVGIGGSALGPQFVCDALGTADDPMIVRFIDNTDPDGIDRVLAELDDTLDQTLTVVISKSGGTIETRNGMLEVAAAYRKAGLQFAKHGVAVTCEGSALHAKAVQEKWLRTFPMWDWVGGRTSVLSAAGLLPIALQGVDIDGLLEGAGACDEATRNSNVSGNPAALMALMWYATGQGRGNRNMVVLPYRDRLVLLGRYLQQLMMESLGKETDRDGNAVFQGLTVYGNKGSTDQHAYVQQLRDGRDDFFVTFLQVLKDREGESIQLEEAVSTGDYLHGFLYGTRAALTERGRRSMTISFLELNARTVGALIALFERTVGLYAELINVNAYHQPGVEAGKKAASKIIELQRRVLDQLRARRGSFLTAEEIAEAVDLPDDVEHIHHLLEHVGVNKECGLNVKPGSRPFENRYGL